MKRSRYTEEQIIGILKEQEAGISVAELCRKHGMSDATFYTWKDHPPLPRHNFQCLDDVLAEFDKLAATARTARRRRHDDAPARQVRRQGARTVSCG
jgi:hypothetical protein